MKDNFQQLPTFQPLASDWMTWWLGVESAYQLLQLQYCSKSHFKKKNTSRKHIYIDFYTLEIFQEAGLSDSAFQRYDRRLKLVQAIYEDRGQRRPLLPWDDDWYRRCQYEADTRFHQLCILLYIYSIYIHIYSWLTWYWPIYFITYLCFRSEHVLRCMMEPPWNRSRRTTSRWSTRWPYRMVRGKKELQSFDEKSGQRMAANGKSSAENLNDKNGIWSLPFCSYEKTC